MTISLVKAESLALKQTVQHIAAEPLQALAAATGVSLTTTTTTTCEQTEFVGMMRAIGLPQFLECSSPAKHVVEWGEKDMHPGKMYMCDEHMRDFLADAEYCDNITWTFVGVLKEQCDSALV